MFLQTNSGFCEVLLKFILEVVECHYFEQRFASGSGKDVHCFIQAKGKVSSATFFSSERHLGKTPGLCTVSAESAWVGVEGARHGKLVSNM